VVRLQRRNVALPDGNVRVAAAFSRKQFRKRNFAAHPETKKLVIGRWVHNRTKG
jgi:hypothetical protein